LNRRDLPKRFRIWSPESDFYGCRLADQRKGISYEEG
jgi:hypothetical protein